MIRLRHKDKKYSLLWILLFLIGINFTSRFYVIVYITFALVLIIRSLHMNIDIPCLFLYLFSLSMIIFSDIFGSLTGIFISLSFLLCHIIGANIVQMNLQGTKNPEIYRNNVEKSVLRIIYVLNLGMFAHFMLNALFNIGSTLGNRKLNDIWTGSIMAATRQSAIASVCAATCVAFIFESPKKSYRILSILSLCVIGAYNLKLGGRTLFGIIIVNFVLAFMFEIIISDSSTKRKVKTVGGVALILIVIGIVYSHDIFNIKTAIENTTFYQRFFGSTSYMGVGEDTRLILKEGYLKQLLDYPWGRNALRKAAGGGYAHDLLLDIYSQGGALSCAFILVYVIISFWSCYKILFSTKFSNLLKLHLMCVYVSFGIMFIMEPIIDGLQWLLAVFCIVSGAVIQTKNNLAHNKIPI